MENGDGSVNGTIVCCHSQMKVNGSNERSGDQSEQDFAVEIDTSSTLDDILHGTLEFYANFAWFGII